MKQFVLPLFIVTLLFVTSSLFAQDSIIPPAQPTVKAKFTLMGSLMKRGNSYVDLYIKKSKNPCGTISAENKFKLDIMGLQNFKALGNFISWKMDVINCNDEIITKTFSIDLSKYQNDGEQESLEWSFESQDLPQSIYDIRFSKNDASTQDVNKGKFRASPPDSIFSKSFVRTGNQVKLTAIGGNLSASSKWYWFEGGCEKGQPVDSGKTIYVKLIKTTTFYVCSRLNGVSNTKCISKTINVNDSSYAADNISGNSLACPGQNNKQILKVLGGQLGLDARWVWYKDNCGYLQNELPAKGNGEELEINPDRTTTYFVRAEGRVNKSECIVFLVKFTDTSTSPVSIKTSSNDVCQKSPVLLSIVGGNLSSDAKWEWLKKANNSLSKIPINNDSASITEYPDENTQYFVRAKGFCGITQEKTTFVSVKPKSTNPSSISILNSNPTQKFDLSIVGGELSGKNAKWIWKNNAEDKVIHTGTDRSYLYKTKKPVLISVSAADECGSADYPDPASVYLSPNDPSSKRYGKKLESSVKGFLNFGMMLNPSDSFTQYLITYGIGIGKGWSLYVRTKFSLSLSNSSIDLSNPIYTCDDYQLLNFSGAYQFNGKSYTQRASYTTGLVAKISKNIKFYFGGGYGQRQLIWGVDTYSGSDQLAKNIQQSINGPEGETGLMLKFGGFNIMGGINAIYSSETKKSFIDFDFGVGFAW